MPTDASTRGVELVFGGIRHARLRPTRYVFAHAGFHLRVPLAALLEGGRPNPLLGLDRAAPLSVRAADHGDGRRPLDAWLRDLLDEAGIQADGPVFLHAFPRVLGHAFKPVSFWFCHGRDGDVRAIVAEVNNTFGERHCYLLAHADGRPLRDGETLRAPKRFHVSPFCEVAGHYEFRFMNRPDRCVARVELHDADGPLLLTSLSGARRPADARACLRALLAHPLFTLGVIVRIHWHALRLWRRRVPFHPKPAPPSRPATPGLS